MWDFRSITEFMKDTGKYIIIFVSVFLFFMFVISFQFVVGNSMSPTIDDNEMVAVEKISMHIFGINRFDIVSLKSPDGKLYTKRIIGLPGDEIYYLNNTLYVNKEKVTEPFLKDKTHTNSFFILDICSKELCPDGIIPKGYYLVLGDNRTDSLDSRDSSLGLIPIKNIIGKAFLRIWPLNKIKVI